MNETNCINSKTSTYDVSEISRLGATFTTSMEPAERNNACSGRQSRIGCDRGNWGGQRKSSNPSIREPVVPPNILASYGNSNSSVDAEDDDMNGSVGSSHLPYSSCADASLSLGSGAALTSSNGSLSGGSIRYARAAGVAPPISGAAPALPLPLRPATPCCTYGDFTEEPKPHTETGGVGEEEDGEGDGVTTLASLASLEDHPEISSHAEVAATNDGIVQDISFADTSASRGIEHISSSCKDGVKSECKAGSGGGEGDLGLEVSGWTAELLASLQAQQIAKQSTKSQKLGSKELLLQARLAKAEAEEAELIEAQRQQGAQLQAEADLVQRLEQFRRLGSDAEVLEAEGLLLHALFERTLRGDALAWAQLQRHAQVQASVLCDREQCSLPLLALGYHAVLLHQGVPPTELTQQQQREEEKMEDVVKGCAIGKQGERDDDDDDDDGVDNRLAAMQGQAAGKRPSPSPHLAAGAVGVTVFVERSATDAAACLCVECVEWLEEKVDPYGPSSRDGKGNRFAQFVLGYCAFYGVGFELERMREGVRRVLWQGVRENEARGFQLLTLSALQRYAPAQHQLGLLCAMGLYGEGRNMKVGCDWFRRAAKQGFAPAQYWLGRVLFFGGTDSTSCSRVRSSGSGGSAKLGVDHVVLSRPNAVQWWLLAAEQHHREAQFLLGRSLCYGTGVAQDEEQALLWLQRAATAPPQGGHSEAQLLLGRCYYQGLGTMRDRAVARRWLCKAAAQGLREAQDDLATLLFLDSDV